MIYKTHHTTFGSLLPQRNFSSEKYRYGWNKGSEKDDEITGVVGAHITTFFREYDTRLGRTWTLDPVFQPWQSSYTSMDNNPIWFNDPLGDQAKGPIKDVIKGIGNLVSGRPWGAQHKTDLGPKIKRDKEWAFARHSGGIVTENYLSQLKSKADRSESDPDLGWSKRLHEKIQQDLYHDIEVKDPSDLTAASTTTGEHHVPDVIKAYQAEVRPVGPLAGGMQLDIMRNDKPVFSATGFAYPGRQTFKVLSGDDIKLNLSRIQPQFNNIYSPSGTSVTTGNTLNTINIIPSFTFQLRLQIKQ